MKLDRLIGHAPRSHAFRDKLHATDGICIGCKDCTGLCATLIEVLLLPEAILGRD